MNDFNQPKKRNKTTKTLFLVLLILLLIAWISGSIFGEKEAEAEMLYNLNTDKIDKLEIIKGGAEEGETTILKRINDGWAVGDDAKYPADIVFVEAILKDLKELRVKQEAVSENVEKQAVYEVDGKGMEVKIYRGDKVVADFFLGKYGPDYNSNYIRKKDSNKVYLTATRVGDNFGRSNYREMTMLKFDAALAKELLIKTNDSSDAKKPAMKILKITKENDGWKADSVALDKQKVDNYILTLSIYRGEDIITVDEGEKTGFDNPPLEVSVILNDGSQKVLTVGLGYSRMATYYAKSSDSDKVYIVTQWQRDDLKKIIEDFK